MSDINPSIPQINEPNSTADPKIITALNSLVSTVNSIEAANLATGAVGTAALASSAVTPAKIGTLPHVRVTGATNSMSDSTFTTLTFPTEVYDTEGMHSTSVNTGRLTAQTAGLYLIGAVVEFAPSSAVGNRKAITVVNGTDTIDAASSVPTPSLATAVKLSTIYRLAVNDYVSLSGWQNSGGSLAIYGASFWMTWIGA